MYLFVCTRAKWVMSQHDVSEQFPYLCLRQMRKLLCCARDSCMGCGTMRCINRSRRSESRMHVLKCTL